MGFIPLSVPVLKPVKTRTHNHGYGYSRVGVRIPLNLPVGYPCPTLGITTTATTSGRHCHYARSEEQGGRRKKMSGWARLGIFSSQFLLFFY